MKQILIWNVKYYEFNQIVAKCSSFFQYMKFSGCNLIQSCSFSQFNHLNSTKSPSMSSSKELHEVKDGRECAVFCVTSDGSEVYRFLSESSFATVPAADRKCLIFSSGLALMINATSTIKNEVVSAVVGQEIMGDVEPRCVPEVVLLAYKEKTIPPSIPLFGIGNSTWWNYKAARLSDRDVFVWRDLLHDAYSVDRNTIVNCELLHKLGGKGEAKSRGVPPITHVEPNQSAAMGQEKEANV